MGFLNFYSFSSCLTIKCNKSRYLRVWKSLEKVSLRTTTFKAFASLLTRPTLRSLYKNKTNNKLHVLNINQNKRKSFSKCWKMRLFVVIFNLSKSLSSMFIPLEWKHLLIVLDGYVGVERTLKKKKIVF